MPAPKDLRYRPASRRASTSGPGMHRSGIKRIDATITKIADKQVVAQLSEIGGGQNDTPRGIERASGGEGLNKVPLKVEHVYET